MRQLSTSNRAEAEDIGDRPRYYRATSSPTPPPPGRELSELTYSPTSVPSTGLSPSPVPDDGKVLPEREDGPIWKGLWKGRKIEKSRMKRDRESGATDDSMENQGRGRRHVEKFFIEPVYHGVSLPLLNSEMGADCQKAKIARDARIAHYKDLKENYKLVVEEVYF